MRSPPPPHAVIRFHLILLKVDDFPPFSSYFVPEAYCSETLACNFLIPKSFPGLNHGIAPWYSPIVFGNLFLPSILGQKVDVKSGDLIRKGLLPSARNSRSDNRYAVSNESGYAVLINWIEYAILVRRLDTPYPVEVDMPYSAIDQNSTDTPYLLDGYAYWSSE
ncbi:hypothetical protein Tco_0820040 [Tanacetum coccineum]|uniref:Uncharacterized protein n=1 Tax=Tanacetum coccineum TaxID=301880 RepID=A0ABQ5A955_9ASTR